MKLIRFADISLRYKIPLRAVLLVFVTATVLTSSLLAGYAMAGGKSRSWIHIIGFALIMATTVYVILDLEFPRVGFIRVNAADRVLIELRESMN